MTVFDHMRERLARLDIAGKGQKRRARGVVQLGVGDDHVEDRLRAVGATWPQTPSASNSRRQAATMAVARGSRLGRTGQRRIGDDDGNIGAEPLTQRQRQRQPRKRARRR